LSRSADELDLEARRFAAYLVDREPPPAVIARYRRANAELLAAPLDSTDRSLIEFARRRPSLLPLLDGASGLLRPRSVLRRKILLMLALLETSPELAEWFETPSHGAPRTIASIVAQVATSVLQVAGGVLLWPFVLLRGRLSRGR
jgi:hypothetical protein